MHWQMPAVHLQARGIQLIECLWPSQYRQQGGAMLLQQSLCH